TIDENSEITKSSDIFVDVTDPIEYRVVVRPRHAQEFYAIIAQPGDRLDDVVGGDGDVLAARPLIELQILVDLGFLLSFRGLIERELDSPVAVGDNLGHQSGVLGGDRLVVEGDELAEA